MAARHNRHIEIVPPVPTVGDMEQRAATDQRTN
jgi:hypothetical protein